MAAVDLRFSLLPDGGNLCFGGDQVGPSPPVDASFEATLPSLACTVLAIPNASFALVASLPGLAVVAEGKYQSYTTRPIVGRTASPWQPAGDLNAGIAEGRAATEQMHVGESARWADALDHLAGVEERRAGRRMKMPVLACAKQQNAVRASSGLLSTEYGDGIRFHQARRDGFAGALALAWLQRAIAHQDGWRDRRQEVELYYEEARRHHGVRQYEAIRSAAYNRKGFGFPWQNAWVPAPGIRPTTPVTPPTPQPCYTPSPMLRFAALAAEDGRLRFVCEQKFDPGSDQKTVVVPIRRVYFVVNNVTLHRVADGVEVPVFNLSLAFEAGSWTWGFDASLPAEAESLITPAQGAGPVALLATVNGTPFYVFPENISRERVFGNASIKVSGRGRNAVLAAPYAPVMSFTNAEARTARQLMDDVLTLNGVPLGWTVYWGLTDWHVPAGTFALQGTWIEALTAIAGAAGAYLVPDRVSQGFSVRPRYPAVPWAWEAVTPDVVLPVDAVVRESMRWIEKPAYNRVFVAGQAVGVLARVTRAGTAGDSLAPMVVDPLITEAAAARQRGISILSDSGRQIEVSLRLPVLGETGIIEPGAFVEYQDGSLARLGLVRSTRVEAGWPEVWQTLGVEIHA